MASKNINVYEEILNKIDKEIITLNRTLFDALSTVSILKFAAEALRDTKEPFTKH